MKDLALDRATLERPPHHGLEPVEPRPEQRVQARREVEGVEVAREHAPAAVDAEHALVHEHGHELLDEQRIAT